MEETNFIQEGHARSAPASASAEEALSLLQAWSTSIPPDFIIAYATVIFLSCTILITIGIFIEAVATMTKQALRYVTTTLSKRQRMHTRTPTTMLSKSRRKLHAAFVYLRTPAALLHQVLDRICPVRSHTPSETPTHILQHTALPERLRSPCCLCRDGIRMGDLRRCLPCGHVFHARCIDAVCLLAVGTMPPLKDSPVGMFQCPQCSLRIFPTPDLVHDHRVTA